jgi:adenylate kinase
MFQVVYLTGAPASGKSSLAKALSLRIQPFELFEYGRRLTEYVAAKTGDDLLQTTLREKSAAVVTPADVSAVDRQLLEFVDSKRTTANIIIDSHAVTKESYGYRVTPFKLEDFALLRPTQIWLLYISPGETIRRIAENSGGRPSVNAWEADFHLKMQASVAITYGMHVGVPVHIIHGNKSAEDLAYDLERRFSA